MRYSSSIIDRIKQCQSDDPKIGLAYVYLSYSERGEQSVKNILCSFIKQLVEQDLSNFRKLRKLGRDKVYKTKPDYINIKEASHLLQEVSNSFGKLYVVVDAFDESQNAETAIELAEKLKALQDGSSQTKILITLRPGSSDYLRNFERAEEKILQVADTDNDIVQYVKHRMHHGFFLRQKLDRKPSLLDVVIKTVSSKCAGMFLLARLHMDSLAPLRQLRNFETRLGELSDHLEDVYDETVERLYAQEKENVESAEQILEWLLHAARPLKVNELLHALAVVDNDETDFDEGRLLTPDDIEDVCKGLVVIEQGSSEVQLVHHTAQEYFKKKADKLFPKAPETMTKSCIKYLEYTRFARRFEEHRDIHNITKENPFLRYAIDNFGRHSNDAAGFGIERIVKLLRDRNHHDCITQVKNNTKHTHIPGRDPLYTPLYTATMYNLPKAVKLLLEKGESVNSQSCQAQTAIHEAAYNHRLEILDMLLAADPPQDLGKKDHNDNILLHAVAVGNCIDAAKVVLQRKSDNINHQNTKGDTPLHDAASYGSLEIAQLLIDAGADLNISNRMSQSAIHGAIWGRKPKETIQLLLKAYHPNYISQDFFGVSPLHAAAAVDFKDEIELIVKTCPGAISRVTYEGKSALHDAAEKGCATAVETLIKLGTSVNLVDKKSRTALWWAMSRSHEKVANILLDVGADPSIDCPNYSLAFEASKNTPALVKRLLNDKRFNYTADNHDEVTCLHHATWIKSNDVAMLYLEHDMAREGKLVNATNEYGSTPLHDAAWVDNVQMVRLLLEAGADTEIRNHEEGTPLEMAMKKGHAEIAELIREHIRKRTGKLESKDGGVMHGLVQENEPKVHPGRAEIPGEVTPESSADDKSESEIEAERGGSTGWAREEQGMPIVQSGNCMAVMGLRRAKHPV